MLAAFVRAMFDLVTATQTIGHEERALGHRAYGR